ncbi:Nucleotide-binding universal stress protein, UspA family [Halogranum amylolyticum]|uniref:Nucleotide-binding universal stress protein, UspA family n=1 Tax=Halogranum amylolyticum TaxID=660520 RepID=A0A1H8WKX6_9EURY|nr:universal stress protein [Halogranum amylolyticum]SEP27728.1 Nucleotide-binding universal stress protein, UspA family [Halogranum amylolyticum]
MSSRVLVPVDGSEASRLAFAHATVRFRDGHVTLLHVIEPFPDHSKAAGYEGRRLEQVFERRQQLLDDIAASEAQYAGTVTTELVYGRPVRMIPRYVENNEVDEVVVGSRGRDGTSRLLLGSVAETVVRRVPVPVTVVRSRDDGDESLRRPAGHVLVPFDRSVCSRHALKYAFERFPDAAVTVLFVAYPPFETVEPIESGTGLDDLVAASVEIEDETDGVFELARQVADRNDRAIDTVTTSGDPAREILEWIDGNDVDHVVVGCHGRNGVARWLLGSVAETVVRRASVTVTAVK